MLTLICGSALPLYRAQLSANSITGGVLLVVPDELTAAALATELWGGAPAPADTEIIAFDNFLSRLLVRMDGKPVAPDSAVRAAVLNIIERDPDDFDYLVGRNSVPRMSQGVLDLILRSINGLRHEAPADDAPVPDDSPRRRQLKLLAGRLDERLEQTETVTENIAAMQGLVSLNDTIWQAEFPGVSQVRFLDFLDFSDSIYLAIGAISRLVENCDVLLEFDPESDHHAHSSLENAYQRLYDMAEKFILGPEDLESGFEELPEGLRPMVVCARTLAEEVSAAAAAVKKLLADANEGKEPYITLVLPNWNDYAAPLEKELGEFGIRALWLDRMILNRCGAFHLLERLGDCCGKYVSGKAVSRLFRAPGFTLMLDEATTSVEAWDLASRLDYILTFTGQLSGWKDIQKSVAGVLKRLQGERKRHNQWSEEEGQLDGRLLELLQGTSKLAKDFSRQAPIGEWCESTLDILASFSATGDGYANRLPVAHVLKEAHAELQRSLIELSQSGKLISGAPVDFREFLSLWRTAVNHIYVDNSLLLQTTSVCVCTPAVAETLRSDCCMMLGCNDGSFPRFARPEASFMSYGFQTRQAGLRSRQRATLSRIIRNHKHVLMWMPELAGTEEMLPSQFAEELLSSQIAARVTADELLHGLKAGKAPAGRQARNELVQNLAGLTLTESELGRFSRRGRRMHNIASAVSIMAHRSHRQLSMYDGIITDPRLKAWLKEWAGRHIYSVSQLDAVVGCSFRFFADRMLNLEELDEADDLLPSHIFGSFTHDVLARFYRAWVAAGRDVPTSLDEQIAREDLIRAYNIEIEGFEGLSTFAFDLMNLKLFGELGPEGFARNLRPLEEIGDPGVFGQFLLMEMRRGNERAFDFLQPSNFEVGFGMGTQAEDDPLSTPEHINLDLGDNEIIKLRGRIDRIDVSADGIFAVTDYKTGKIPEKRQILGGFRTQLPVYMMVGEQLLNEKYPDAEPAGGLYYSLKRGTSDKVSGVFFRSAYQKQAGVSGRSCLKDDEFEETLDKVKGLMRHSLKSVRMGYLTTTRHDPDSVCNFCAFEKLCYRDVERTAAFWDVEDGSGE